MSLHSKMLRLLQLISLNDAIKSTLSTHLKSNLLFSHNSYYFKVLEIAIASDSLLLHKRAIHTNISQSFL